MPTAVDEIGDASGVSKTDKTNPIFDNEINDPSCARGAAAAKFDPGHAAYDETMHSIMR
jgi:hypothetical protein